MIIVLCAVATHECETCPIEARAFCSKDWIGIGPNCYLFERRTEVNHSLALTECKRRKSSLASTITNSPFFQTQYHYWVQFQRPKPTDPWPTDTKIRGQGSCAYLDTKGVSSTLCDQDKGYVCQKPITVIFI